MKFGKSIAAALVATSLVVSPVVAQAAAPADRLGTEVDGEQLRGGFIIPLLALAAIILGLYVAFDNENDAVSP